MKPFDKVRQQLTTDCGVASLAMLANVSYAHAQNAFAAAGLDVARGRRAPFTSNFKELTEAAQHLGLTLKMTRFKDWGQITDKAILKVMVRANGDWHWVVAGRGDDGIIIYDPGIDIFSYEVIPPEPIDERIIPFAAYQPQGNILTVVPA